MCFNPLSQAEAQPWLRLKLSVKRDVVRSADASSARIWCHSQHTDEASALLTDSFNRTPNRFNDSTH